MNLTAKPTETISLSAKATWLLARTDFTTGVEIVTPELAKELLTRNKSNRPLSKQIVASYAGAMKSGEWKLNGQSVVISDCGILRDGQHRLHAVVEAGIEVPMLVTSGVDDKSYRTLDTGLKRNAAHVLSMEGFKYATTISGGLREYATYKKGFVNSSQLSGADTISNEGVFELALDLGKERVEEIACITNNYWHQNRFFSPSQIFGFILILDELHPTKWLKFMDKFFFGIGVEKDTPEYWLIARARRDANTPSFKTPSFIKKALFIKAFNAYLLGKEVKALKFNYEDEKYPRFIGDNPRH